MEISILYNLPRTEFLDGMMLLLTKLAGAYGQLWLAVGILLILFRKTRWTGVAVIVSYFGVLLFGELLLKHLISRPRPCQIDQAFVMLVDRPTSSSFPSTHSAWSFGGATAIFQDYKKAGIAVYLLAALIAYSRLYLFLHNPTDVLAGMVIGILCGIAAVNLSRRAAKKKSVSIH